MRLRVFVKIGSRGPDGDIHDLGVAGAGLSEQAVAYVVAFRYKPLPVDERVVLRVGFPYRATGKILYRAWWKPA